MYIPLFTSDIFRDEITYSLGNDQKIQSPYLFKEDFIAILTNIANGNMKKDIKDIKMLPQSSKGVEGFNLNIDDFSDILGDLSTNLEETLIIDDEELKTINAVIDAILNVLSPMRNIAENNDKVVPITEKLSEEIFKNIDSTIDIENGLVGQAIKNAKAILTQKPELMMNSESRGSNADIEKITNNLYERNINQVIPKISNYDLNENIQTISKLDTKEPLNKDNNLISLATLNHSVAKDADILKYSFNEHFNQNENNPHEMKYASKETPFPHSGQTFSHSIDKNLQIESSMPRVKIISNEAIDINETKIYFTKVDNSTFRLEIKPEGIGQCDIELTFEKGVLNAQILASDSAGKNFFDNNLSNIINNLLQNENNPHEMKYASKETPFPHSGQTFSHSIDKNLQIESSMPRVKIISNEAIDINETKIYFTKVDNSTFRLEIKPEGIGQCDIELTFEKGVLNAQILASDSAGKNFFDNNLSNIINNLLRDGLNVGKFSVSLGERKNDTNDEKGGGKQKAAKLIEELNSLNNHYKNSLISIFI